MFKVSLINMPFANLSLPSIALTQLRSVLRQRFEEEVRVQIHYLSHEFAHFLGLELYSRISGALQANNSGLGDWFFRQAAFPPEPENVEAYLGRYFARQDPAVEALLGRMLAKRRGVERFLQQLITRHRLHEENVVGFTSMFAQNVASFALARCLKERNPEVVTVVGGANCEAPMGQEIALSVPAIDFVFSGASLVSFPQFIEHQRAGQGERCHFLRGVFSARNVAAHQLRGAAVTGQELPIEVPVALDYDDFLDLLETSFPGGEVRPSLTFETSRGCWWGERSHCTFCGLNGGTMAYRGMPSAMALELFAGLFARYGARCQRFESVDNIMPRPYLTEVFPHLQPPAGTTLFYEVKADLKEHEMEILSRAGVTEIQPGIEALATSTLKLMRKGTTAFQNLSFLKNCKRFGISPAWNLLIGFPGEDEAVYKKYLEDLPLLMHLLPPNGAYPVRFDRFSPYFTGAEEYGLELSPYDFYRFIYPFPEDVLANLAYFFEDRNYQAQYLANLVAWQNRLNAAVDRWKSRASGADGGAPSELVLSWRDGAPRVLDCRFGERIERVLSATELRVLETVDRRGMRLADVARHLGLPEEEIARTRDSLRAAALLFEEDERFQSVVIDTRRALVETALEAVA